MPGFVQNSCLIFAEQFNAYTTGESLAYQASTDGYLKFEPVYADHHMGRQFKMPNFSVCISSGTLMVAADYVWYVVIHNMNAF